MCSAGCGILKFEHGKEGAQVWVLGKLIVKDKQGNSVTKMQFGRADIKLRKDGKGALDYGNDLKAASTDALKKCAAELGIASDVYGKNEFKEITPDTPPKKAETVKADNKQINALKRQAQSKFKK